MPFHRDTAEQRAYKKRWQRETEAGRAYTARAKARTAAWFQRRREEQASFLLFYKQEHPCVDCGERDPQKLDFDHRDPATKLFNVGGGGKKINGKWPAEGRARSVQALLMEIDKCDIRCKQCHIERGKVFGHFSKKRC